MKAAEYFQKAETLCATSFTVAMAAPQAVGSPCSTPRLSKLANIPITNGSEALECVQLAAAFLPASSLAGIVRVDRIL